MKQKLLFLQVFVLLFAGLFSSCSSDDDESSFSDIIGTWSGTYTYYNPVGGQKYQYLTIWFYENGTGELEYESPTSSSFASFIYSVAGNVITCQGAWANSDADYDVNFAMTLRIEGDRLIPQDRYSTFILTRDGSIVTDSSGNEVVDNSSLLKGVWVSTDGTTVTEFFTSTYDEYVLDRPFGSSYVSIYNGNYSYSPERRKLWINTTGFDISVLNESVLKLTTGNNTFSYKRGSKADIPSKGSIAGMLIGKNLVDNNNKRYFYFNSDGSVAYMESSNINVGSWGKAMLDARGTYTLSGNTVRCTYTDVSWTGGEYSGYENIFPGWTYGKSCTKTYTVKVEGTTLIFTMPDGKNIRFSNL